MADLKTTQQGTGGYKTDSPPKGDPGEHNQGAEFGTAEPATRGADRDADPSGTSINQGHGHPREERGQRRD
jgi:hypothetical protein